ncbi:vp91/p95 [Artaxa digramma nucleopolyhedrovirus]|uniref:Vp91/p95 n=1 Tax=Artaxa digramma nucleopolyhedrovirus TaxID=3070910 RepID=A0AAE6R7U3_9ABAC|nr:vp91/p95 [Euproctis digramma nucleopolyhedrovirus]QHB21737.1 vp91/p95 [Artaxa digramma nucleopolyhedrovirus]
MSTVPLLLVAIFLIVIFLIIHLILYNDFNENEFNNRLQVTLEYMRRTNAEHPLPEQLSYVSSVNAHYYTVTTFDTYSLTVLNRQDHDDRFEVFDFISQTLLPIDDNGGDSDTRVRAHPTDNRKFQVRGDDGWMDMECPFSKRFDTHTQQCVPIPFCENKPSGNYGLTEQMIDSLILHHVVVKSDDKETDQLYHPTMYLRCFEGGSHATQECPPNHLFDSSTNECVLRNECDNRPDNFVLSIFPENLNIDEYLMCINGEATTAQCPNGKMFDRRLMRCVDADPCAVHGAGYTYITNEISDAQFFQCVSDTEATLMTCLNRVFVDDQYMCSGDIECVNFNNGTGTVVTSYEDDIVQYDTGVLICDNFNLITSINCDTTNLIENKVFNGKLTTSFSVPRQIYNSATNNCVDFDEKLYNLKNNFFTLESLPNDLNVEYETAVVGRTNNILEFVNNDRVDVNAVVYAKDNNEVGLNPLNGEPLQCYGDALYDVFDARRINVCDTNQLLTRTINVGDNQYIRSTLAQVVDDEDYDATCVSHLNKFTNYIDIDVFSVSISTNILHRDVCGTILEQIHAKYNTLSHKYTTIDDQYTFESVKPDVYINKTTANTLRSAITISPKQAKVIENNTQKHVNNNKIKALFDPFEHIETIKPAFNPFDNVDEPMVVDDDDDNNKSVIAKSTDDVKSTDEDDDDVITEQRPELILADKLVTFSCFYALPTFKFSSCNINDNFVSENLSKLRSETTVHPDCVSAAGLSNVLNAYAYLGNDVGCRSSYTPESGITVDRVFGGPVYLNVDTQSNDGVKYNNFIHKRNNIFLACPNNLLDDDNFICNIDSNVLYYIENLQQ